MKKTIITSFLACWLSLSPTASKAAGESIETSVRPSTESFTSRLARTVDLGLTLGTTGVGLEVSAMPTSFMRVRAGVDYMPRFNVPLKFGIDSYRDGALSGSDFSEIQQLMKQISGFDVDQTVRMNCKAKMVNFKLLVDFFPLRNKHWYATAGFYWGSKNIGSAINAMEEMPSLLAIGMFNQMHDWVLTTDFIETPIYEDVYLDPDVADRLKEKMEGYGRVGIHVGDHADGSPYMMEPDKDGTVKADMFVNSFKPYLGLGYVTSVGKDKRINIGVDGGVLFWGGTPSIRTHENVDLSDDVNNITGKVGDYVETAKSLKVYPVVNFRIAYRTGK